MKVVLDPMRAPRRFRKFGKLPGKPSALIYLALDDLARVKRDKNLNIDMEVFMNRDSKGVCSVCLAGSIMAKTLNCEVDGITNSRNPTGPEASALWALDFFRKGSLESGFHRIDLPFPDNFKDEVEITDYEKNPKRFRKDMRDLAKALEKEGY